MRVFSKSLHNSFELVHSFVLVALITSIILSPEMPPLKPIDWSQVPLSVVFQSSFVEKLPIAIAVPNVDVFVPESLSICFSPYKPQQLLDDSSSENFFGRQQRKGFGEIESHRFPENSNGSLPSSILSPLSLLDYLFNQVQILIFLREGVN